MRFDTNHQVPQAVSSGQLTEDHAEELIPTREVPNMLITIVFDY